MSSLVYRIGSLLCRVVRDVPVGTNLGLVHLLWTILSGRLLSSRGAVIPALADAGLGVDAVRRAWAALCYGKCDSDCLLARWQQIVTEEGHWRAHRHGGYRPVAGDLVGFFRPHLKACPSKHYCSAAGKSLPAIVVGVLASIGSVNGQRLPVPRAFVRAAPEDQSEAALQARLLSRAKALLADDEAWVSDRGFAVARIQQAGIERYVARCPKNFTARRAAVPAYKGWGRPPTRGEIVRPLPRQYKGRTLAATPPDRVQTWWAGSLLKPVRLRAQFWDHLVLIDAVPGAPTFSCVVILDPRYVEPLVLCTPLSVSGQELRAMYRDRWPIEQLPLCAKQVLGAARQFVFGEESRQRLPELSLLSGAILMYVAATQEAVATGFWDRAPQPTCGRVRRVLARADFSDFAALPAQVRKKDSPTAHLPKGVRAHRRQKASAVPPDELLLAA
jgi:hypothetical protein